MHGQISMTPKPTDADETPAIAGQQFRDCIARFPSGVHVITTAGAGGRSGFTATAVASVSDDPPTVLVCLNRKSQQNDLIQANGCFAINLLPGTRRELSDIFAGRTGLQSEERFAFGDWTTLATGAPVLADSIMTLDCRLLTFQPVGTHNIYFGIVVGSRLTPPHAEGEAEILIYHDRHYSIV